MTTRYSDHQYDLEVNDQGQIYLTIYSIITIFDAFEIPAASDMGLHCLSISHKKDARLIWIKSKSMWLYGF